MNILDIISKKRDSKELSKEEIEYFVKEYTDGNITDYQASALIMAIYINGMNDREITDLTLPESLRPLTLKLSPYVRQRLTFMRLLKFYDFYDEIIGG